MRSLQITAVLLAAAATLVGLGLFTAGAAAIVRTVARGGPAPERRRNPWRRTWLLLREVLDHRRFRSRPAVRVAHWVVMLSFPVLLVTLATSYGQLFDPYFALPLIGHWAPLEWLVEVFAWTSLLGIALLVVIRQREHPRRSAAAAHPVAASGVAGAGAPGRRASRFFGSNAGQAYFVEAVIAGVVLAVLVLRALEYALSARTTAQLASPLHFPLTAWYGEWLTGAPTTTLEAAVVVTALVKILVSMTWMIVVGARPAMGVSWHRFLALPNIWARRELDGRPALGPVPPVRAGGTPVDFGALDDLAADARLGVGQVSDFTWKGLLDLATCTECGRCQEQCPAWATGKVLSPKLMVLALRDHAFAGTPGLRPAPNASTEPSGHTDHTGHVGLPAGAPQDTLALVGDVVDPEALWDCTTCGACVTACPVDIEHVDHFIDLRRHQVLMAGEFPPELTAVFTGLERQRNPWGFPARNRMDWAGELPFPVPVIGRDVADATAVDYLFWVGCAGAFDDQARRTTRAVAELLHRAGVSFAVLGTAEGCSGDPARRAGNEFLFQQLAQETIATLRDARAHRILTTCPHCFNTIGREYPQLGAEFEVVHHTELLDELVSAGRLTPVPGTDPVTFHDPCYLGRHNDIYQPPRNLVAGVGTLTEMPRSGERSFCCGAGGARMWLEERRGERINADRAAEAIATGAPTVATACPFCTVMLTNGVASGQASGGPEVSDVAVLLLDAVRRGE